VQRGFDIFFSAIALLILSPLFLLIIPVLFVTGEGEVFYKQERIGINGNPFSILKFATMLRDSPYIGTGTLTVHNDPRVLPFGKFLRKTKINELPQLINVLLGDMSLIGPRPLTIDKYGLYNTQEQDIIYSSRPGLSGIGSIVFRDEESHVSRHKNPEKYYEDVIVPAKVALELWYSQNASLNNYFLLILITAWVIILPKSSIIWKIFTDLPKIGDFK
jgi:lipopolysaccharide/colanic/teichoic acid biosynthesis glycosyltransferase